MRIPILVIVLLASLSAAASAETYVINEAYEISVADLVLPGTVAGSVSIKECDACERRTIRVTSGTRYLLNDKDVSLADLRKAARSVTHKETNITTVIHNLESNTILAIHIYD